MAEANLSADQAKDHIEMVDRILSRAEDSSGVQGWPFILWGVYAGLTNIGAQLASQENHQTAQRINIGELVLVILLSAFFIVQGILYRRNVDRASILDRHFNSLFMTAWIVALLTTLFVNHIFQDWARSAIWSLIYGITMMSAAALIRSRIMFAGGAILIVSLVAANYFPQFSGYLLGGGFLVGFCGVGILLTAGRR